MPLHRTAQGKMIDMSSIVAKNEKVRAVGNMNVNARGDILDSNNKVIKDNNKRVKANYQKVVSKAPAKPAPSQPAPVKSQPVEQLTKEEREIFDDDEDFEK
jgi:hypothetical protein